MLATILFVIKDGRILLIEKQLLDRYHAIKLRFGI